MSDIIRIMVLFGFILTCPENKTELKTVFRNLFVSEYL